MDDADVIAVRAGKSVLSVLRYRRRNAKAFEKISRGHSRDSAQCCVTSVTESQRIKWMLMEGGRGD